MNCKSLVFLLLATSSLHAKNTYPGDLLGRDLDYPGLGWLGHIGIATGEVMNTTASIVIETLNQNPVIQINSITQFKRSSKYWGSKYGIGDYATATRNVLIEANHQRWWCPKYTNSTAYTIGDGNLYTGQALVCGVWRCDTFVAWSFFKAGYYSLMNNKMMLPVVIFNSFPYGNTQLVPPVSPPLAMETDKTFISMTADELNTMPYEEFESIADIPLNQETPAHIATEWRFTNDEGLNDLKRGIFIDRLAMIGEQGTLANFIRQFSETERPEIKSKLILGTMIYYQSHMDLTQSTHDKRLLQGFYTDLLSKELPLNDRDNVIRGFVDVSTPDDVLVHVDRIDEISTGIEPHLLLGLKLQLARKSKELEQMYMPSTIHLLKKENRSDLDDMFFGITAMSYKGLQDSQSILQIKDYMDMVNEKYMASSLSANEDAFWGIAKRSFIALRKLI